MTSSMSDLIFATAAATPQAPALTDAMGMLNYADLAAEVHAVAAGFLRLDLPSGSRVAVYLPKRRETVVALFAAAAAGLVGVPINPALKAPQVMHILNDCAASVLVTGHQRLAALGDLNATPALLLVALVDDPGGDVWERRTRPWAALSAPSTAALPSISGSALAAILYTSGSTGRAKGVMVSHDNVTIGARSVVSYLGNTADDRILALLPISFDYGLNQLTSGFLAGAHVVLHDFLLPGDVVRAVATHGITGLGCVPPLWHQLAEQEWPAEVAASLRYITNSGGHMPRPLLTRLRGIFPQAKIYLMYGLTEAFRSTYLDPALLDSHPGSIGMAIPDAEVLVIRPDGQECAPGEVGELVHIGPLVALGYWGDPELTAKRFRPAPAAAKMAVPGTSAVWSGDHATRDAQGLIYFVGRHDDMIKTSGYRVSPTEVEEAVLGCPVVAEAVAAGVADERLGQAIVVAATAALGQVESDGAVMDHCRKVLPTYMVPREILWFASLPRNANGKLDRPAVVRLIETARQ